MQDVLGKRKKTRRELLQARELLILVPSQITHMSHMLCIPSMSQVIVQPPYGLKQHVQMVFHMVGGQGAVLVQTRLWCWARSHGLRCWFSPCPSLSWPPPVGTQPPRDPFALPRFPLWGNTSPTLCESGSW